MILDAINLDEFVPIVVLIGLLSYVGEQIVGGDRAVSRWARRTAAAAFICYAIAGICSWSIESAWHAVEISIRALLAAGLTYSLSLIFFPSVLFTYQNTIAKLIKARRISRERKTVAQKDEEIVPPVVERIPEPPSLQERVAAVKEQYQARLDIIRNADLDEVEQKAAEEAARQKYLWDINQCYQ